MARPAKIPQKTGTVHTDEAPGEGHNSATAGIDLSDIDEIVDRIENIHSQIDEIMDEAKQRCSPLRKDIADIKDKAANENSIPKKALSAALRHRRLKRQAEEVSATLDDFQTETYEQILHKLGDLAELPLGQAALEKSEPDDVKLAKAFNAGKTAVTSGRGVMKDANPYPSGSPEAGEWDRGWDEGQASIAAEMAPKEDAA